MKKHIFLKIISLNILTVPLIIANAFPSDISFKGTKSKFQRMTLSPINVSVSVKYENWVQTISICNTTQMSIPLSDIEINFNYAAQMPTNIWGNPWAAWKLQSQSGEAVVLKGGTPYTPALLPDPACTSPLTIQFNASPDTPLASGPFIFKASGTQPEELGDLTINMPTAPTTNLPNPTVKIQGDNFTKEQTIAWGDSWQLNDLSPGAYTIDASPINNGTQFYESSTVTASVENQTTTTKTISYSPVVTGEVLLNIERAPTSAVTVSFTGEKYNFTKNVSNGSQVVLPKDTYTISSEISGYLTTVTPNPLTVPEDTSLSIAYTSASACNYDVNQDQLKFVKEYTTTAKTGWYTDTFSTPVTTVNGTIYYVYVRPDLSARVGQIKNGIVSEYDLDKTFTVTDDGHNEFSIALDRDGYVHVTGGMHNSTFYYWRSNTPYNLTTFTRHFGDIDGDDFTYNGFRKDSNNELYMYSRSLVRKVYYSVGGRGASIFHYNRSTKHWDALGGIPKDFSDTQYKTVVWENSGQNGTSYQMYKSDLRFDKQNHMYFTVPVNDANASNTRNYAVFGYSGDGGKVFRRASSVAISPMPMRVDAGSSQADIIAGYYNADMGEHSGILLDSNNNPGVYYSIDGATWYKYYKDGKWSSAQKILTYGCSRCVTLSDQDNGVMTLVTTKKTWHRFTKFGDTPRQLSADASIYRWDLSALRDLHVYRGVSWNSSTGEWSIYRVDISNPTKCY